MDPELSGRQLTYARLAWITFAFTLVGLQVISLTAAFRQPQSFNLGPDQIQELQSIGLSVRSYGTFLFLVSLPIPLVWSAIGLLIFWRKSTDRGALMVSAMMIGLGVASSIPTWRAFASAYPDWLWIIPIVAFVSNLCLYSFFLVFPTGRYVPRWTFGLAVALSLFNILNSYGFALPPSGVALGKSLEWLFPVFFVVTLVSLILAPIYRYRRVSTPIEREQIKWVVFTIVVATLLFVATALTVFVLPNSVPDEDISLVTVFVQPLGWLIPFLLIPLSIAVSIFRYRLFDIDLIIRKTLVYAILTATLALIFFGGVTLLQGFFQAVSGQQSAVSVVISTLAIYALFNPLRKRVQDFIDRRFYRKKYDAEKTLARFAAMARDETDIEQLSAELVAVVQETMQPESVSLWLKPQARKR